MSQSISTALRLRNRSQPNPVVVSDAIAGLQSDNSRILSDSLSVVDSEIATYTRREPGDTLTAADPADIQYSTAARNYLETITVQDSLTAVKSSRKTLFDECEPTDVGILLDRQYLRNRLVANDCVLTDSFQKTITKADFQIINKVLSESIEVNDNILVTTSGIQQRTLSDSIAITDVEELEYSKELIDTLASVDSAEASREQYRELSDSISLSDDMIVTRAAITNSETVTESITLTDRLTGTYIQYKKVSAKILHGIEAQ